MIELSESYRICKKIAKEKARNFFYAFRLLPKDRMDPMCAIYAFMRHSDDLIDSTNEKARLSELSRWRHELKNAFSGLPVSNPIFPAFIDTVRKFSIPEHYFFELLDGMEMDLKKNRYQTFEELYSYCYRVASVVGIVCIHIFGFRNPLALSLAESAGIAFQLTNILRDLREDTLLDRIYLPLDDLSKFNYSVDDLKNSVVNDSFRKLFHFEIERARTYYEKGNALIPLVNPESRCALSALFGIYEGLLKKINSETDHVMKRKVKLSLFEKIVIVFRSRRKPLSAACS